MLNGWRGKLNQQKSLENWIDRKFVSLYFRVQKGHRAKMCRRKGNITFMRGTFLHFIQESAKKIRQNRLTHLCVTNDLFQGTKIIHIMPGNLNQSRTTLDIVTWNELLSNSPNTVTWNKLLSNSPQHWNMELITLEQPSTLEHGINFSRTALNTVTWNKLLCRIKY